MHRRWARRGAGALVLVAGGIGAAGCSSGSSTGALEHTACVAVHHSVTLYDDAAHEAPASATRARTQALALLRSALAPASIASSADADYQALSATLSESSRVPEGQLIVALNAQCAAVLSSN